MNISPGTKKNKLFHNGQQQSNKAILIILLLSTFFSSAYACLNRETEFLKDNILLYLDLEGNVPRGHVYNVQESFTESLIRLDSAYRATKDIGYLADKGIILILLKRYDEAIKLYLDIEKMQPGRYSTASNIGTAYELIGENENALKWIKKALSVDAESHHNSEWIHVNILKAKINGEQFYNTKFLLNTDFGTALLPVSDISKVNLENLSKALYYQLNERVGFVKPKEKLVAQLLFDLGNIAFLLKRYSEALDDYALAEEYGFSEGLIRQRKTEAARLLQKQKDVKQHVGASDKANYLLYCGIFVFILTIGILFLRRRKGKRFY